MKKLTNLMKDWDSTALITQEKNFINRFLKIIFTNKQKYKFIKWQKTVSYTKL